MTPSKILFFLCLSFIIGVGLESLVKIPQIFLWIFLFVATTLILSGLPRRPAKAGLLAMTVRALPVLGFCLIAITLGILRMQISEYNIANDKLSKFNEKGVVILQGVIIDALDMRDSSQRIKVKTGGSVVLITTNIYPKYNYLDQVKITGKLETPFETEDFSYKNYLLKDGIYSVMGFPKIEVLKNTCCKGLVSSIYSKILFVKEKLRNSIQSNFAPPYSSILQGTILGENAAMSQDLKDKLNITGLRHIIAVSGTHVVILTVILMALLLRVGLWRQQAFYLTVVFIWVYVILTGLSASGVRAGIMGCIFLLAEKLGKQGTSARIIILAGAVMLFINPLLLFYDVGFQLSFMAVLGLIYFEPMIKTLLKVSEKNQNLLTVITATLSAQIFTLPILIFNFGNISFVSPITNILVSPIVSFLMIFGFLSSVAGIFWNFLGWVLSIPCYFLLSYFLWVIEFFAKPWAMIAIKDISYIWFFVIYFFIATGTYYLRKKFSRFIV